VLIVDRSAETREVLQTALQRRGLRTFGASRAGQGLQIARQHHPDLIVLDLEVDDSPAEEVCAPYAEQTRADKTPLVVLGTLRRGGRGPAGGEFVSKPYHYGPLVRKIEELLDKDRRAAACSG
jgi:DNA-binding response OmpR family regulator